MAYKRKSEQTFIQVFNQASDCPESSRQPIKNHDMKPLVN